jgi:uncharacterized protein (DUF1501 family)
MKGDHRSGIAVEDPQRFYMNSSERFLQDLANKNKDAHNDDPNVSYLYKTLIETTSSAEYVYQNSKIYKSKFEYPNTQFGKNLKTIAQMIISNIDTSVYYISMTGFDTHVQSKRQTGKIIERVIRRSLFFNRRSESQ